MSDIGYRGISYPFRIGNNGGVVMSTTSKHNASHIAESIQQILNTEFLERPMESDVYTTVTSLLFEPNNETLQQVLRNRLVDDITRLDPRVKLDGDGVEFEVKKDSSGVEYLYMYVTFSVVKYSTSKYTAQVKVGEVINE